MAATSAPVAVEGVRVGTQGQRRVGMSQSAGHGADVVAATDRLGGRAVAQIVQSPMGIDAARCAEVLPAMAAFATDEPASDLDPGSALSADLTFDDFPREIGRGTDLPPRASSVSRG